MLTDIQIDDSRWTALGIHRLAETAACATLERLRLETAAFEIAILACDDGRITTLNRDFRGKPAATNVLSWPSGDRAAVVEGETPLAPDPADPELGDVAIAYETCAREATAAGTSMEDHVTHLIIHGTLHLLGYDHERDGDATLMEELEIEILGKLGIAPPY